MKPNETPESGTQNVVGAVWPRETQEKNLGEAALTTSPTSSNGTQEGHVTTRGDDTATVNDVTPETALDATVIEAVPSIRNKILAARKAPEEVAQLIATQSEQLSVPVYKRLPDGAFWRVRTGEEWDPHASEVLLLPRKDGGGGPEFLLVLPELESLFQGDPKLRNMVRYHYLAFVVDARGRVAWWAVPSRSDNVRRQLKLVVDDN